MTHPASTDVDVDLDLYEPVDPGGATAPMLDAEADVAEWDIPVDAPARAAAPTPRAAAARGPSKAEIDAAYAAKADTTRRARRRRRLTGVAISALIFSSAAASVVGWPLVLAGLAAGGGTGAVGYAAVKGTQDSGGRGGRPGRGPRGGGPGLQPGGRPRSGLFGGGRGRASVNSAMGRRPAGGGGGLRNPLAGLGRKSAAAGAARKAAAAGKTSGARSGPGTAKKPGSGATKRAAASGLGLGGPRRAAGGLRASTRKPVTGGASPAAASHRSPRTASGQARQAKRQAIRHAKQQVAVARGKHNAAARMRPAVRRHQRALQRAQQRWQHQDARREQYEQRRQQRRDARRGRYDKRRDARRLARQARTRRSRAFYRRYFLRWAAVIRRRTAGAARAVALLLSASRQARTLEALRTLDPTFGRPGAQPFPPRPGVAPPMRGMSPGQQAAVAAAFGIATAARRAPAPSRAPAPAGSMYAHAHPVRTQTGQAPARRPASPVRPAPPARTGTTARPRPSTRNPRPAMAVPPRPPVRTPRGPRTMSQAAVQQDGVSITHRAWEAAMSALLDQVASYEIPEDNTGVLDVDSFIGSIGGFMLGFSGVLDTVGGYLAEGPTNAVVVSQLAEFSIAISAMSADAAQVYESWRTNEDNAHDIRRAEGEIANAHLFNVGG